MYHLVVYLTVAAHFAFVCYAVAGGFLALRWRRTIWLHALAVAWGVLVVAAHLDCPLTWLERWARVRAQMAPLPAEGFIAHYITGVFYPADRVGTAELVALTLVAVSWVLYLRAGRR
ncbi:MAG TPA: DUF2784 domain-containing protein [Mycobacterium sp.]|nr:DUF2784 domain-containing protein [Mycobacterium sp.]